MKNDDGFFDLLPTQPASKRKAKPPDTRTPENIVQKHILKALIRRGLYAERINVHHTNIKDDDAGRWDKGRFIAGAQPGHSDICGCIPPTGRAFYLEVKKRGEKPTKLQQKFLDARAAQGALTGYADSVPMALKLFGYEPEYWEREQ